MRSIGGRLEGRGRPVAAPSFETHCWATLLQDEAEQGSG